MGKKPPKIMIKDSHGTTHYKEKVVLSKEIRDSILNSRQDSSAVDTTNIKYKKGGTIKRKKKK